MPSFKNIEQYPLVVAHQEDCARLSAAEVEQLINHAF